MPKIYGSSGACVPDKVIKILRIIHVILSEPAKARTSRPLACEESLL
jgi:hypothetical protein